jgi:hypothetical protein
MLFVMAGVFILSATKTAHWLGLRIRSLLLHMHATRDVYMTQNTSRSRLTLVVPETGYQL